MFRSRDRAADVDGSSAHRTRARRARREAAARHHQARLLDSAEAVPESEYSFRPATAVRTFGELMGHAADLNTFYCALAAGANPEWNDTAEKVAKTKASLIKALKEAVGQRDQMRVMVLLDNVAHLNEHYGNIVTYMRMKGHVPPSTLREQRGSGD